MELSFPCSAYFSSQNFSVDFIPFRPYNVFVPKANIIAGEKLIPEIAVWYVY